MKVFNIWGRMYTKEAAVLIPLLLSLYICVTNLAGFFSWPYVVICLLYLALQLPALSVGVLFVNIIYLGFSYINLSDTIGFSNNGFVNLCYLVYFVRAVITWCAKNRRKFSVERMKNGNLQKALSNATGYLKQKFREITCERMYVLAAIVLVLYMSCCGIRYGGIKNGLYTFLQMFVALYLAHVFRKREYQSLMSIQFTVATLTVFVYHILQFDQYAEINIGAVNGRFSGVRDPNNFAIWCNLSLCMVNLFCRNFKTEFISLCRRKRMAKKYFHIVGMGINAALIVGVLLTISISGYVTLLLVGAVILYRPKWKKVYAGLTLLGILSIVALFIIPLDWLTNLGGMFSRVAKIVNDIKVGNISAVTSGRLSLWSMYWNAYCQLPMADMLIGNMRVIPAHLKLGLLMSHNAYLDFLINYGVVGISLMLTVIVTKVYQNWRVQKTKSVAISLIFMLNVLFRSGFGVLSWFTVLIG